MNVTTYNKIRWRLVMEMAVANLDEYNLKIYINKTNECRQMDDKTQRV